MSSTTEQQDLPDDSELLLSDEEESRGRQPNVHVYVCLWGRVQGVYVNHLTTVQASPLCHK